MPIEILNCSLSERKKCSLVFVVVSVRGRGLVSVPVGRCTVNTTEGAKETRKKTVKKIHIFFTLILAIQAF
jgi:hypothetical protein